MVLRVDHDVFTLDVAMDDSLPVCFVKGFSNLQRVRQGVLDLLDRNLVFQRGAIDEFHNDKLLVVFFLDVVDRADIRMIQRRSGFCFLEEPRLFRFVGSKMMGEKLHRNEPIQFRILSLVNDTHAPLTQLFENLIMRYGLPNHGISFGSFLV